MGENISRLAAAIEAHLLRIEKLLPPDGYKLTLLARHPTNPDGHILMSVDEIPVAIAAMQMIRESPTTERIPPEPR